MCFTGIATRRRDVQRNLLIVETGHDALLFIGGQQAAEPEASLAGAAHGNPDRRRIRHGSGHTERSGTQGPFQNITTVE